MTTNEPAFGYYKQRSHESVFETYLRHTNQKEMSAAALADILKPVMKDGGSILDIGTGEGEYLRLALSKLEPLPKLKLTLIEPAANLAEQLQAKLASLSPKPSVDLHVQVFDDFATDEKYDVVLAAQLFYHMPHDSWGPNLGRMISLLKPGGRLIVVLREKDEVYEFKMQFKPLIYGTSFKAKLLDDVLACVPEQPATQISRVLARCQLSIPIKDNLDDSISIAEFLLAKDWDQIPQPIQQQVLEHIKAKGGLFQQLDGIAVITSAN